MHALRALVTLHVPWVILVTESWCSDSVSDIDIHISGYTLFRKDRPTKRGGGCLIYTSSHLDAHHFCHPSLESHMESLWVSITTSIPSVIIGCIYIPPNPSKMDLSSLIDIFNLIADTSFKAKIIAGDFNMPDLIQGSSSSLAVRGLLATTQHLGWRQLVNSPTRQSNVLDLVFTLNIPSISASVLGKFPGSDHRIVACSFNVLFSRDLVPLIQPPTVRANLDHSGLQVSQTCRPRLRTADWLTFASLLRSVNWDDFFHTSDPTVAARLFTDSMLYSLDLVAPHDVKAKSKKRISNREKRISKKIQRLRAQYNRLSDFPAILQLAKFYNDIGGITHSRLLREEKAALSGSQTVTALSQLLKRRKNTKSDMVAYITTPDKSVVSDPKLICQLFNDYFSSIFTKDRYPLPTIAMHTQSDSPLSNINIEISMVKLAISTIKPSLRPGHDGIPPVAIKLGGDDIPLLLTKIFNVSMERGIFPSMWKTSIVIPRHKSGPRDEVANYRPINHTPITSRIFEKLIKNVLANFLAEVGIINSAQHGFLSRRSYLTCQLEFLDHATLSIDRGMSVITIYLDMHKAFDRVPHQRLLLKLRMLGIADGLLNWLSSFLSDRQTVVKINDSYSSPHDITSGVIQGSVLGPTLFLMYVNDIFSIVKRGRAFMFADDIKIAYTFRLENLAQTLTNIQQDLDSLHDWSNTWQIMFSPNKSYIIAHKCQVPSNLIKLGGINVPTETIAHDLGMRYANKFNFSCQTDYQLAKARQLLGIIARNFRLPRAKLILYKTQVRPLLEYCYLLDGSLKKCDRVALESFQRGFTKSIVGYSSPMTYRERCLHLSLEPLWLRRLKLNFALLRNIVYGKTFSTIPQLKPKADVHYDLRNKDLKLWTTVAHTSLRKRFFVNMYAMLWNKLPPDIRTATSLPIFKKKLHMFLSPTNVLTLFNASRTLDDLYENGPNLG